MSFEAGGRTDKAGNRFEIRYFILQLLKVIEEEIRSATLEALGDDEKGTDIWIENKNGTRESQQCKGRYGNNDNWNFSAMDQYEIFKNWKYQLDRDNNFFVSLVSPISFIVFEDLIKRAKNTSDNPKDFYENQIKKSDDKMTNCYSNYCKRMKLNPEDERDLIQSIDYLNRTNYHQIPDEELKNIILNKIKYLFIGDTEIIYNCFVELVLDENILAQKIDVIYLDNFIKSKNIMFRNLSKDDRILPRITELNNEYNQFFSPINGNLIEREEFTKCKELIEEGKSIIIHGKAGYGKSGITQLIIQYCEQKTIPHIAIKLDKRVPRDNVEEWSKKLGLPTSIGFCIDSISKNKNAVIILDQLDALRWTQSHSRDALLVCTELIEQIKKLNFERQNKISIIFVCRTYDLENDNSIKLLFKDEREEKIWKKINVEKFSKEMLKSLIGTEYAGFSKKLQELLRIPSNLYIWSKLDKNQRYDDCNTTNMLIQKWWSQLLQKANELEISEKELQECKNNIVTVLDKAGRISILRKFLDVNASALDYLYSNGFLIIENNIVSFTHQSLLDYFLEENMLYKYQNGNNIEEIIGDKSKQTPARRYQIQMLLEDLANSDTQDFICVGRELLESNNIRFYIKYVFFEVLGQITDIDYDIEQFILEYYDNQMYGVHVLNNVIYSHPQYVRILIKNGIFDIWMKDDKKKDICINLLGSIKEKYCVEDVKFIEKYLFNCEEDDKKIYRCFNYDINDDIDEMFELRMKLYNKYPELSDEYINLKKMLQDNELRAIRLIKFWLDNKVKNKNKRIYKYEEELITEESDIIVNNDEKIIEILLPCIPKETKTHFGDWTGRHRFSIGIERACVELIKKANANLIKRNPDRFLEIYEIYMGKGYPIFNEFILNGLERLPVKYSDYVIGYLCADFKKNIFDESSGNGDELLLTKNILKKHSVKCSKEVFENLEEKIYFYQEDKIVEIYKRIREYKLNYTCKRMYWDCWGNVQVELLPYLPYQRLNYKTRQLMKVLNRKFKKGSNYYKYDNGHSGSVWSPISNKNLSNKQWIRLFSNKKLENLKIHTWKEVTGGFIESSMREFTNSFNQAVSNEPIRMINLVLSNSNIILDEFVDALYSGLQSSENIDKVPIDLLEKVFKVFPCDNESQRANCICWIIYKRKNINWSQNTLNLLKNIAINHKDPVMGKPNVTNDKDKEIKSIDMLQSNSLNCTRGKAAQAIGHLLWENRELFEEFKETIQSLSEDINPVVRFASLHCLLPAYNIQKDWAREKNLNLFETDIRLVAFWHARDILFFSYDKEKNRVLKIIENCYYSEDKELKEIGSYCVVEMYILKNEFSYIMNDIDSMDENQIKAILRMAINYFNNIKYNQKVKNIISRFKEKNYDIEQSICRLFYDNLIDLNRDKEFLKDIMNSTAGRRSIHSFIHYIDENAVSILDFKEIIIESINSILENSELEKENIYYYGDELSKLIVGLYDETVGKKQREMKNLSEKCLDIWDEMFEKQIGSIKKLSRDILDR